MLFFDHIVIGCTDLGEGTDWAEKTFGVKMQPGGKHAYFGTHNNLLGMGDIYLEVIARNPFAAPTSRPTWFGLDSFAGAPRLCNWVCQSDDLQIADEFSGPPLSLSRDELHWQITVPDDGNLPMGGGFPTLLKWGEGITSPASRLPDSGIRLQRWQVSHPDAECIVKLVNFSDPRIHFVPGKLCLTAVFDTPKGVVTLKSH